MAVKLLLDGATSTGVSAEVWNPRRSEQKAGIFQVDFSAGVGTVTLEGRLNPSFPWETIVTIASTDTEHAAIVTMFPNVQANVTAFTSGVISAAGDSG